MLDDIFELMMKMSSLSRYSQTHLVKDESVLEHTGFVCLISYIIAQKIDNGSIDFGKLLKRATVHDIDETVTGDIPRPTKYANDEITKAIKFVEEANMWEISNDILGNDNMFADWSNSKSNDIEGQIVALADCLAVLYKIWQESILYNNKTIFGHIHGVNSSLSKMWTEFDPRLESYIKSSITFCNRIRKQNNES